MKKALLLSLLSFSLITSAQAQYANSAGDVVLPGSNAWTLHTPDDGRTTMYIAPWTNGAWQWGAETQFFNNGDVQFAGKIRIGNRTPQTQPDYRLSVDGKIVAQSLFVTAPSSWADFVFAPTYRPMPLADLENYLLLNRHLPNIPSANEVETNGYSIASMDAKMLQTIEELTLRVIELSKQNKKIEKELSALQVQAVGKRVKKRTHISPLVNN